MNTIGTFLGRNWTPHALNGVRSMHKEKAACYDSFTKMLC